VHIWCKNFYGHGHCGDCCGAAIALVGLETGSLVKTLDGHFARVTALLSVTTTTTTSSSSSSSTSSSSGGGGPSSSD